MNLGLLLIRLVVGVSFMGHGAQKLFGWFGGYGPMLKSSLTWLHQPMKTCIHYILSKLFFIKFTQRSIRYMINKSYIFGHLEPCNSEA